MKTIERTVEATMPPATAVPTEFRAAAPAPRGERQRQHAENERERRHQNRPQADARRLNGGLNDRLSPRSRSCSANSTIRIEFFAASPTSMTRPT